VEDHATTREMLQRMLAKEGWQVITAENGRVGLQRAQEQKPALVLLDLMMPEMDGFQFAIEFRKEETMRNIPIIVITAKDITEEDQMRLSGYVETIVRKEAYGRDVLLNEVRELVNRALVDTHQNP
jgi:CheY-like chemotaxis protein